MFIVQGISRVLSDPGEVRKFEEYYDSLLHKNDGIYWNMYLDRLSDPSVTIHTQDWKAQENSEAFGISPEFQATRRRVAPGGNAASRPVVELSPGYWRPLRNFEYSAPPTGYDPATLGVAHQSIVYVNPGREMDYQAVEDAIGERLSSIGGCYWFRYFHSLGYPNVYSRIIHWCDKETAEKGITDLGGLEANRLSLLQEELGDLCRVKLYSDWPERRARDGV
jgi:hypothetical protein